MKLLIIGGTIFLGRHLVEAALAREHEVTLFNRGIHDDGLFPQVEKLKGDRTGDLQALRGRRWDAVVDTCGYVPKTVRASAQLLADAVEHYTFVSSQSVYANFDVPLMDESAPVQTLTAGQVRGAEEIKPTNPINAVNYGEMYGGLKALCEQEVSEVLTDRALNIRAGLIVGAHDYSDRFTYWVRRVVEGGEVLAPGQPARPVQFVDAKDLADWIVRMAEQRRAGTFNATGPDYQLSMEAFLEECRSATGSDARLDWVSDLFLETAGVEGWREIPLWMAPGNEVENFFSINCRRAINAGLTFRPLAETVRDTLAWDMRRPAEIARRAGLRPEREVELLQAWHKWASSNS